MSTLSHSRLQTPEVITEIKQDLFRDTSCLIWWCLNHSLDHYTWSRAIASVLLIYISRTLLLSLRQETLNAQLARERGAQPIPRVRGRLPWNFDILLSWLYHSEEDVGRLLHDLSIKYGPTVNTRVLGEDQILSLDPVVFDAVMRDQFKVFAKGESCSRLTSSLFV